MSLHTWCHQGPHKPSSCTSPLTGELPQAKKVLHLCAQGHFSHVWTLYTVACQASLSGSGALQARILEHIGQYRLPYPFRALYFLLP